MKEISLNKGMVALVDDDDFKLVSAYTWHARFNKFTQSYYAYTNIPIGNGKQKYVSMSRLILGITDPYVLVDHWNHKTLDNRRYNLRVATQRQNQQNQLPRVAASAYKGVSKSSSKVSPWRAQIRTEAGRVHLGNFETEHDAACAYDFAASILHGKFAYLNFPDTKTDSMASVN